MAKAIYGHIGVRDARLTWENDRLRARVVELEAEVARLSGELSEATAVMISGSSLADQVPDLDPLLLRPALA